MECIAFLCFGCSTCVVGVISLHENYHLGMNLCKLDGIDVLLATTIRNQDPVVFRITLRLSLIHI